MEVRDLVVEVRDANLNRVGQIVEANLPGLKLVQRFNNVGTWEITLPADDPIADELRAAGAGIIITGDTGILMSGFTTSAVKEVTPADPVGAWKIQGVDDSVILGERLAYPTPGTADVTAQTTETDARSGFASTVMYEYVDANIGPSAPAAREIPYLSLAADAGLGSTVYKTARFRVLGEVLSEIGSIDPIGFRVQQSDDLLEFSCYAPTDRTGQIRLDVVNDTLSKSSYGYGVPSVTRAIVGGTGQGTARTFLEVSDTESLAAETLWGRRIETFVDQNNEPDADVLNQAGLEKIAEGGRTGTSVSVLPSSDLTMAYGRDWYLGDRVTVVVGGQEVSATVTETAITVASDGIRIGATVGDPSGVDFDALITKREQATPKRLNAAELKESGGGGGGGITEPVDTLQWDTTFTGGSNSPGQVAWTPEFETLEFQLDAHVTLQVGQEHVVRVKNASGSTAIPKRTLVMFAGATGDTVTVSPATNTGTTPSHYFVGVAAEEIPADGFGFVTVEGFLTNLDTSAWSVGQLLYLSSATAGLLTSTQPSAPSVKTAFAAVTRSHASTGRILVRMSYDPTLAELPDVSVTSATAGDLLRRNSGNTRWENVAGSTAGLTPTGSIIMFGSATAPAGWLLCNGQSTSGYTALAAIVGATVPDLRNRFVVGAGSTYGQGTTGGATSHAHTLSNSGYAKARRANNRLVMDETVAASWTADMEILGTGSTSSQGGTAGIGLGGATDATVESGSFLPPYYALTYIIKT